MKKTILSLVMILTVAFAASARPVIKATPAKNKANVEFKGDSIVVSDGEESVTVSGLPEIQKVRDKINQALDDTLTGGSGTTIEIGDQKGELSPDDIKEISNQWASVVKQMVISGSFCLLGLVALVLFFRYMMRRRKYDVMEKAIMNNYPLNDVAFNESKNTAIYVPQPVYPANGGPRTSPQQPVTMNAMPNWRALMPAVKWIAWGVLLVLFSVAACNGGEDPFWPIGLVLMLVGVCKGFILYKEQKVLQEAWNLNAGRQQQEPMREGIPVPPPFDEDYKEDDSNTYQPY
jgi:hypothetical protein